MISYYSIYQYCPVIGEATNFAAAVWRADSDKILYHVTNNFKRLKQFGQCDVNFIKDFIEEEMANKTIKDIEWFSKNSSNLIQLTEKRGSTLSPELLLSRVIEIFFKYECK